MPSFKAGNPGCCCDGGGGGPTHRVDNCTCLVPDAVYMRVATGTPAGVEQLYFPAALIYQPRPADLSTYAVPLVGWYSDVFASKIDGADGHYRYRYYFRCSGTATYGVAYLFTPDSPTSYPGTGSVTTWQIGIGGSTCSPFLLLANSATFGTPAYYQGITVHETP